MAQVKVLTKFEGRQEEYFGDHRQGMTFTFFKFVSQEKDNGVPKYEIFVMASDPTHPVMEEVNKNSDLLAKGKDKAKRYFFSGQTPQSPHSSIKDASKYQKGKEFIDELESELNKKTEAIVNRTSQQEQELKDKKQELAELERQQQGGDPKNPTNY
ncbi:33946_t:CDS:2 [Racocetra persica]|uniref:33946_t:CDS:1 n=1 Tax=Racocetra persica TaxID=160502 RepID=A0ACA9RR01_9GLOM|nr:33946_t:CDS:2 [Racocetra persica]